MAKKNNARAEMLKRRKEADKKKAQDKAKRQKGLDKQLKKAKKKKSTGNVPNRGVL